MTTLAEIKRTVQVGAVYDVTNHYITRTDHPCYGTRRESISDRTNGASLYFDGARWGIPWPKSSQVQMDADGTIRLYGGGAGQPADELFMTLTPVTAGGSECDECGEEIPDAASDEVNESHGSACSLNPGNGEDSPQVTTDTQGARFALDESKAQEWLTRVFARAEAIDAGREPADDDVTLPHITRDYRASDGGCAGETASLVRRALADGVITDPEQGDLDSLAWEWIPSDGVRGWAYRWLLHAGPGNVITVAYPSPEDPWDIGLNEYSRELAGTSSALSVLREAVQAGNELNGRLGDYVASLPLAARAPEIAQLVAQLPADEWGADELATLGNWLGGHGYDTGSEDE